MRFDVVVIGAGPAGLSFASALEPAGLDVAVVERQPLEALRQPAFDGREIALTHATVDRLRRLGVWQAIPSEEVSPLRAARVLDDGSQRPLDLEPPRGTDALALLVSNHVLRRALFERVEAAGRLSLLTGEQVVRVEADAGEAHVELGSGRRLHAPLLIAADSRISATRTALGIPARVRDHGRTIIVFRAEVARPHGGIAYECFDYGQTVALLPLNGDRVSVVLTLPNRESNRLRALDDAGFDREVEPRLARRGYVRRISERFSYPVMTVYPSRFTAERCAVIGDAAVGMHPVTAHGFNLGLLGAATLARFAAAAAARGEDVGSAQVLERYERRHRLATLPLYLATNGIVDLYTRESSAARLARAAALHLADRAAPLKALLTAALTARTGFS